MNLRGIVGAAVRRRPWLLTYFDDLVQDAHVAMLEGGDALEVRRSVWRAAARYERGFQRRLGAQGRGGTVRLLDVAKLEVVAPDAVPAAEDRLAMGSLVAFAHRTMSPRAAGRVEAAFRGEHALLHKDQWLVRKLREAA